MRSLPKHHLFLSLILLASGVLSSAIVFAQSCPSGTSPVYRFYNTVAGGHFFTIDEGEKNYVANTLPSFKYEGVGFCANKSGVFVGGETTRWGVASEVCCPSSALTYSITIDGVTKKYDVASCTSDNTFEGFATTKAGPKSYSGKTTSSTCGNTSVSGNVTLAANACYLFVLKTRGQDLVTSIGTVTCPSSASAGILREDREATPMAIFPMLNDDGSPASGEGFEVLPH
jgi:hypothetical protein